MVHNLAPTSTTGSRRCRDPADVNQSMAELFGEKDSMATDYDAPRKSEEDQSEESIEELKARRHDKNSGKVDEDETEAAESFELPGADLSHEELAVEVMPRQDDEFTCMSCFLVHHRSQLADEKKLICRDCI
jgi:hypothetical protein